MISVQDTVPAHTADLSVLRVRTHIGAVHLREDVADPVRESFRLVRTEMLDVLVFYECHISFSFVFRIFSKTSFPYGSGYRLEKPVRDA